MKSKLKTEFEKEKECKNCINRKKGHERLCYDCNDYDGNPTYSEWEYDKSLK